MFLELVVCLALFGRQLMSVFTATEAVVNLGADMMRILALGYIAFGLTQTMSGVMRGLNETMAPMWISFIVTIVIRLPLAYGMAWFSRSAAWPNGHPASIFLSLLIAWLAGTAMTAFIYRRGKWRQRAEAALSQSAPATDAQAHTPAAE